MISQAAPEEHGHGGTKSRRSTEWRVDGTRDMFVLSGFIILFFVGTTEKRKDIGRRIA